VLPAVPEEEGTFFGAERLGSLAIQMGEEATTAEDEGVFRRDHPGASRTDPRLLLHRGDLGRTNLAPSLRVVQGRTVLLLEIRELTAPY